MAEALRRRLQVGFHSLTKEIISPNTPDVNRWALNKALLPDQRGGVSATTEVSEVYTGQGGDSMSGSPSSFSPSPPYVQYGDLQGTSEAKLSTSTFLVDGKKIQNLLRPKHQYYAGKGGSIAAICAYHDEDEGKRVLYPKVRAIHRDNPYRKMQLRRQTTGRTTKTIMQLVENNNLDDFRVCDLTLTQPKEVSVWLTKKGKRGRDYAWRMEARFWGELEVVGLASPELARSVNLHVWSTKNPLEPHFHHHALIPNYECTQTGEYSNTVTSILSHECDKKTGKKCYDWWSDGVTWYCADCNPDMVTAVPQETKGYTFKKRQWDIGFGRTGGMWTNEELVVVKAVWKEVVKRFVIKHGIKCPAVFDKKAVLDVGVGYIRLNSEIGRSQLMHKLNYKARHWSEDYAKYSNENLDCADPPDWLMHYDNRTRTFGWWSNMKNIVGKVVDKEDVLSPYTAKKMTRIGVYDGDIGLDTLLEEAGGRLFWVEFIRGRPVEGEYKPSEIEWLRSVCMTRDDLGKWKHNWDEKSMDLQGTLELKQG